MPPENRRGGPTYAAAAGIVCRGWPLPPGAPGRGGFIFVGISPHRSFCGGPCFALFQHSVFIFTSLKSTAQRLAVLLVLALPGRAYAQSPAPAPAGPTANTPRLQPLFGGLSVAQATQMLGEARLKAIAASFASPAEASDFFANKGFEYLSENQPDTAVFRFNLAWLLNPQNPDPNRGLGIVASRRATPDAAIALLSAGVALAPNNTLMLSDLGTTHLLRYRLSKKKKDLTLGLDLLQRATTLDATNAVAWQQLAHGLFYQEKYAEAWAAVHKSQAISFASTDFEFLGELLAKMPDPQGTINGSVK